MANILYGVNGEGAGHSTRAKAVISHLESAGHRVRVVSFDRGLANLKNDFDVSEIDGLRLAYVNNQVRIRRTLAKSIFAARKISRSISKLSRSARQWEIDMVITDFEPISSRVGHRLGLPVVSIDNQHALTNTRVVYPAKYRRDAALAKLVTRVMTPHCDVCFVTSFFSASVKDRRTFVFPPILRQEILRARPIQGEHVLVYVSTPAPALANILEAVRGSFIAYGFEREGQTGSVHYKLPDMNSFLHHLITAKAVIANAGFSLLTEALYLGKPYLAIPISHQFEQTFNAYWLQKQDYGVYWDQLNKERVEAFLYNLPHFRQQLASYPRQANSALFSKLDAVIGELSGMRDQRTQGGELNA
jgi:uncharacterized protein (TIGR00661 family)